MMQFYFYKNWLGCLCLAIIIPSKCKYICNVRTCNYLQRTFKYIPQGLSDGFHVVLRGFWWFPLIPLGYPLLYVVILGYTWLSLVIRGYPWLYLVIYNSKICEIICVFAIIFPGIYVVILGYTWLSTIQIYVKSFAYLQLSFPYITKTTLAY